MSQDELAVMDGGKCILQLRGVRPFLSDKYDITKHPNYHLTADADPRNAFDIERFLSVRLKPKPNITFRYQSEYDKAIQLLQQRGIIISLEPGFSLTERTQAMLRKEAV